jgi:hypothetical protein
MELNDAGSLKAVRDADTLKISPTGIGAGSA